MQVLAAGHHTCAGGIARVAVLGSLCLLVAACASPRTDATPASGALRLPALISDHMVLQRGDATRLHGWAAPRAEVVVDASWLASPRTCRAADDGAWSLELTAGAAGGPHVLRFRSGFDVREITDVLIGDVWVGSGQSNMEMTLDETRADASAAWSAEQLARMDQPRLRLFEIANSISPREESDCRGRWVACTPQSVASFSAVAFHFGVRVHEHTHVPIGLVSSNWGGTRIESWTSASGLASVEAERAGLEFVRAEREHPEQHAASRDARLRAWWYALDELEAANGTRAWRERELDAREWDHVDVPATWGGDYGAFDGVIWLRREFELPAGLVGADLALELGAIDDMDTTWFDGVRVGGLEQSGRWQEPRVYAVPARLATAGTHVLAIRVVDTGGNAGVRADAGLPRIRARDGIGGPTVGLAGAWHAQRGLALSRLERFPDGGGFSESHPTALYNAMIAPLTHAAIRGVIWYQGEANRSNADRYAELMRGLVLDWRACFGLGDLPFYWVQIAPYRYGDLPGAAARVREAQRDATDLACTGSVVTLDVGDPDDIHPKNKQPVGERLARLALAQSYGFAELETSGPRFERVSREGRALRIVFTHASELRASASDGPYELAGADRVFHPARARVEGATLVAQSDAVAEPIAFRYAWCDDCAGTLFDATGAPMAPFRTARWD